jgi:glucose/arabinose dehydrogenase
MKIRYSVFILAVLLIAAVFLLLWHTPNSRQSFHTSQQKSPSPSSEIISKGSVPDIPLHLQSGFTIHVFASDLGSPRDLQFTPGGTLLVSNPAGNEVFALPDTNHDGIADSEKVIISDENLVHGLAFYQGKLFIADVDKVVRYTWNENTLTATQDKVLFTLPENNDHNSRTLVFNNSGQMYVSVGSTCNVCNESAKQGGSVWVSDANGSNPQIFATGLRNAAFLAINPNTGALWGTEMGRDNLGDTIPPDEINIIQRDGNYGWPDCYGDRVHDTQFDHSSDNPCHNTMAPIFQIPAHSAPLGLTFINSSQFPEEWQGDLLVAYHGSWNRSTPIGYKVVHLTVKGNTITGSQDFLSGFMPPSTPSVPGNSVNSAQGRPTDLTFDKQGNLYVSDDKAGVIYIIQKK